MKKIIYIIYSPPGWIKTPPLSLAYLKSYLESKNVIVKILDLNIIFFKLLSFQKKEWLSLNKDFERNLFLNSYEKFKGLFLSIYKKLEESDYIGFSLTKRNLYFSLSFAKNIKKIYPNKKIIFGGPEVLFLNEKNKLKKDYIWVIGEGEKPLYEILAGEEKNIFYFDELKDLNTLPFIDFNCLPLDLYSGYIPILSSRGCPFGCKFCTERRLYKKFRQHSPEYVFDLINYLVKRYNKNNFIFCDSLINYNTKWLEDFCSLVVKNNLNIKWEAQIRITKDFSVELAKLLKKSGCFNLFIGLESGSDKILKYMNKGFNIDTAIDFFKKLYKAGLHFEVSLILGFPNEEKKDFLETIEFIRKNKKIIPKIAQINPFVDYLDEFKNKINPLLVQKRLNYFMKFLEKEKIRYTKAFINNLLY